MKKETNCQCACGLCCATWDDWANHRQASGHTTYKEVTVEQLSKEALQAIEGLKTFKKYVLQDGNK